MRVLEFEAKALLADQGVPIPVGIVVRSPEEAEQAAVEIGRPIVLKAQIPANKRMEAGGIRFAQTPEESRVKTAEMLHSQIHGKRVDSILVEEMLQIRKEVYVGVTYDAEGRTAIALGSTAGGQDVEQSASFVRYPFSIRSVVSDYQGRELASLLGFEGKELINLSRIITQMLTCFVEWDALLLESNPLVLDADGRWYVADLHLELDDEAQYRQRQLARQLPQSRRLADQKTPFEQQAKELDQGDHRGEAGRLVAFDGNLGLLIGGGGASLTIFDEVLNAGLQPANYCEIGGNPSVWKVKELTKLILGQPKVDKIAVIMNVVSNTRTDLVARGVIKGVLELGLDPQKVILAFRVPGSWEDEGRDLLAHYGVSFFGREISLDQTVERVKCQF